ncbi:cache domain-containing sensor histidine kinase [Cohnella hashimotonis]|uniref:Sensor histidine kinase n=1 Tax=Cohnella hashimotonis TaxID=2826895 RepID=A0ABT6TQQ4_9BACL|nr:sensor histidine kinase [Cohnella hashimotonis]MDI4648563.1 sensor histidine kinase [Cohnella hashimotonis]
MKKSIRTKLMALLLAATIVPMALSMVISDFYIKNQVTGKAIAENRSLLEVGKDNILNYMNTLNRNSLSVYNSINSPTSLYAIIERFTAPGANVEAADLLYRTTIYQHLLNMYQSNKEIHQIHLQIGRGEDSWSYLLARGLFRSGREADGGWPAGRADDPIPFMEPAHKSASYALDSRRSVSARDVITLRRPIIRTPSDKVIGYLSIDVLLSELGDICGRLALSREEKLYVLDRGGHVVCGAEPENGSLLQNEGWARRLLSEAGGSGDFKWSDSAFSGYVVYDTLQTQFMDWIVVKQLPYSYLYQNAKGIRLINSLIIALSLIVAVIATLIVSVQFTSPIKKLIARMNLVQAGKWSAGAEAGFANRSDEFGVLERRFGTMVSTIEELINREYKLALANKTNQLKAMQAQINPHFLNNALQSIGTLALQSNAPKVYGLVAAMARMMRYSMNTEETVVPLSAELAHAKAYLELQKQRFGEDLDVYYEIDPEAVDIAVPKMLLQPLVENYFKHGYDPGAGNGARDSRAGGETGGGAETGGTSGSGGMSTAGAKLYIRAWLEGEREWLHIDTADNGRGMEAGSLERLRARLNRDSAEDGTGGQIGLANVYMRLRLYFGEEAGMTVDASPGGGFRAALRIPLPKTPIAEEQPDGTHARATDAEEENTR